jgi:transcription initiation factor TFIIIB Brf1 subunit/transcription initiation factor TFIIB
MNEILTKHGERREIAKIFNVSEVTVRNALKGRTRSDLSKRIRSVAIQRGGIEAKTTKP